MVTVGVAEGFAADELNPSEPLHVQVVAVPEFELSDAVPPTHIGLLCVIPVDTGTWFTVTVVVYTGEVQPLPVLLAVNE